MIKTVQEAMNSQSAAFLRLRLLPSALSTCYPIHLNEVPAQEEDLEGRPKAALQIAPPQG